MQVVNQLLDPRTSEFTAAFVGRLVSTLISRAGTELGEQLDQILRAILSKMQQAETLSVMQVKQQSRCLFRLDDAVKRHWPQLSVCLRCLQSLIMVFAHLVHSQLEPLLEFLCSLPGPTGKPALEFVMTEWMSRQHLFYGQYEGKVRLEGLIIFLGLKFVGFLLFLTPCPTARWPSVSCCSIASTQMINVSKTLL